jgi:hypothetical protein
MTGLGTVHGGEWPTVERPMVIPEWAEEAAREHPERSSARFIIEGIEAGTVVVVRFRPERTGTTPGGIVWRG